MDLVNFITTEESDDLIVSFAIDDSTLSGHIQSLTLLWTPKYDHLRLPDERGVSVSFERFQEDEEDFVVEALYERADRVVRLATRRRSYELDVRKVDRQELAAMNKVFHKKDHFGGLKYGRV